MYQYNSCIVLSRTTGSQWEQKNITNVLVNSIFLIYRNVYLTLTVVETGETIYVDFMAEQNEYFTYQGTLAQWLAHIGSKTLTTVNALPNTVIKYARYADAYQQNYTVALGKMGMNYPTGYPISELPDLKLRHKDTNVSSQVLENYCLVTVNGLIHDTARLVNDEIDLWIKNGANTLLKNTMSHVGLLSFLDIGKLKKYKINKLNIQPSEINTNLSNGAYFTIPEDIGNKAFFLVLGGYLVFPQSQVFWRLNDHLFALKLQRLPFIDRIYETARLIDISSLQAGVPNSDGLLNNTLLWSDDVIKNYMTMSQSFLVTVETETLKTEKINLRHTTVPGRFSVQNWPVDPLIVSHGRLAEYWIERKDREYQLSIRDPFTGQYILRNNPESTNVTVSSDPNFQKPYQHMSGFFLQISSN